MVIASRTLVCRSSGGEIAVPISILAPEQSDSDWICRFSIGWPEGNVERWGAGSDAVQAMIIALQMIGAEIYASELHKSGRLTWFAPGQGYGFPVTGNIRDLLIGDDKRFF
jgi:hypothetical protein